jgi:hypothetical protein
MPYERLLQQGRIRRYQAKPQEVKRLLQVAARDLATADKLLPEDVDWAFNKVRRVTHLSWGVSPWWWLRGG